MFLPRESFYVYILQISKFHSIYCLLSFAFLDRNCPCVPMRERHECHCMLFLTEDNDFAGTEQVSFGCSRS